MPYAGLRTRAWCFTYFPRGDPITHESEDVLRVVQVLRIAKYGTYGIEICPETGRIHLQGFVYFKNPRRWSSVHRLLEGSHIEPMRGDISEAIAYCHKDWNYKEFGVKPEEQKAKGEGEKARWDQARELAISGNFMSIPSDILIKHYNSLRRIEADFAQPPTDLGEPCGIWIHGPSGYGKSHICRELWPEHYPKMCNKWWDAYANEEYVCIQDIDKNHEVLAHHLKIWSDQYVFVGEIKGHSKKLRPRLIIVTSQYAIRDIFQDRETRDALERRFRVFEFTARREVPDGLRLFSQVALEAPCGLDPEVELDPPVYLHSFE